jgi:hypothetical protein
MDKFRQTFLIEPKAKGLLGLAYIYDLPAILGQLVRFLGQIVLQVRLGTGI